MAWYIPPQTHRYKTSEITSVDAFTNESETGPVRSDGLGAGDSHRYGKNYRPQECFFCHGYGHVSDNCPSKTSKNKNTSSSRPAGGVVARRGRRLDFAAPSSSRGRGFTDLFPPPTPKLPQVKHDDPRMNDRNWIAAYPDPADRKDAIEEASGGSVSMKQARAAAPGLAKTPHRMESLNAMNNARRKNSASAKSRPKTVVKTASFTPVKGRTGKNRYETRPAHARATRLYNLPLTACRTTVKLSEQPFWPVKAQTIPVKKPTSAELVAQQVVPVAKETEASASSAANPDKSEIVKQSGKGFLQERGEKVPSHYNTVVFPPRAPKRAVATDHAHESTDSDYQTDVYSDDEVRPAAATVRRQSENDLSDDSLTTYPLSDRMRAQKQLSSSDAQSGAKRYLRSSSAKKAFIGNTIVTGRILLDQDELSIIKSLAAHNIHLAGYDVFHEMSGEPAVIEINMAMARAPIERVPDVSRGTDVDQLVQTRTAPEKKRELFKIMVEDAETIQVYDTDEPLAVALRICRENRIDDPEIQQRWNEQITKKFQKMQEKVKN